MKRKDYMDELKKASPAELTEKLRAAKEELFKLRCKQAVNQLTQSHMLRKIRRDVARINTVLNAGR